MTDLSKLPITELAAVICESLKIAGVKATLSGGACAEIYSKSKYVTGDLDFVVNYLWPQNDKIISRQTNEERVSRFSGDSDFSGYERTWARRGGSDP